MRLPTFDKPRIIACAELSRLHVGLPRGCLDEAMALLRPYDVRIDFEDHRHAAAAATLVASLELTRAGAL